MLSISKSHRRQGGNNNTSSSHRVFGGLSEEENNQKINDFSHKTKTNLICRDIEYFQIKIKIKWPSQNEKVFSGKDVISCDKQSNILKLF